MRLCQLITKNIEKRFRMELLIKAIKKVQETHPWVNTVSYFPDGVWLFHRKGVSPDYIGVDDDDPILLEAAKYAVENDIVEFKWV